MNLDSLPHTLIVTGVFSLLGIALFSMAFVLIVKVTPFSIRKEIEEDQNTSLAILIASVILGIAMIVSAAIHG
jgi:uncharacterized membrane protein YjfL (UPF0719 family)